MDKKKFNNAIEKTENLSSEKTGPYFSPQDEIYANRSVNDIFTDDNAPESMDKGKKEALLNMQEKERLASQRRVLKSEEKERLKELKIRNKEERIKRRDYMKQQARENRLKNNNEKNARLIAERREK